MMTNPFEEIISRLDTIQKWQQENGSVVTGGHPVEIINRSELCRRLDLTEPSIIRWERKGIIIGFRIGASVRYNWPKVVENLEKGKRAQYKNPV